MSMPGFTAEATLGQTVQKYQPGSEPKPLLLVIGSVNRLLREYVMQSVSRRYRLWLLQPAPVTWQQPYLVGNTIVDTTNIPLTIKASRALASQMEVSGVLCYDEGLVLPAAHVAEALGLVRMTAKVVQACRDKHAMRAALAAAAVPQPVSICIATYDEARIAAERIGYPVILKPRTLTGSIGVIRVANPAELEAGYSAARAASYPGIPIYEAGVLIEEYLDGPEISIDSVFFAGQCTPMVLARKHVGFDPFFEEVGHVVSANDPLLYDAQILRLLKNCHAALGIRNGVTHTEIRLTSHGPCVIEVNARLGGDLIPYLGWLASGIDASMAAADVAAGRAPVIASTHSKVTAVRFLYPSQDCQVISVNVNRNAASPAIHRVEAIAQPGALLRLPPRGYLSRYGFVITVGSTDEECLGALEATDELIELHSRPIKTAEVMS